MNQHNLRLGVVHIFPYFFYGYMIIGNNQRLRKADLLLVQIQANVRLKAKHHFQKFYDIAFMVPHYLFVQSQQNMQW